MLKRSSEEVFEEGKSVEEYTADPALVDELNGLDIDVEPFPSGQPLEQVAEIVEKPVKKKEEEKKSIVLPKSIPQIVIPQVKVPVVDLRPNMTYVAPSEVEEDLPLPPPPPGFESEKESQPSFDGVIKNLLSTKTQAIFDKAEKDAAQMKTSLYNNLFSAFEAIANGVPLASPQPVAEPEVQPDPIPIPKEEPAVIIQNSNEEAIKLLRMEIQGIDIQLIESKGSDLKALYLAKRLLQKQISKLDGTYVEPPVEYSSTNKFDMMPKEKDKSKKPSKFSLKMKIATFGFTVFSGVLVWFSLVLAHLV